MRRASQAAPRCESAFSTRAAKNKSARSASDVPYWRKNQYAINAEFRKPPPMLSRPNRSASRVITRLLRGSSGGRVSDAVPAVADLDAWASARDTARCISASPPHRSRTSTGAPPVVQASHAHQDGRACCGQRAERMSAVQHDVVPGERPRPATHRERSRAESPDRGPRRRRGHGPCRSACRRTRAVRARRVGEDASARYPTALNSASPTRTRRRPHASPRRLTMSVATEEPARPTPIKRPICVAEKPSFRQMDGERDADEAHRR